MSEEINPPTPRYVTCCCQSCDGNIEFDANELVEENSVISCPHCGHETKLSIPKPKSFFSRSVIFAKKEVSPNLTPLTPAQINSIGERQNDTMASKLYNEGDQNMSLKFEDARRYVRDPRFKLMNPETGERFTPETLEIFIRAKQGLPEENSEKMSQHQIDYLTSIGVPDADKLDNPNHPWNHQSASPKQIAYLTYMGVANAAQLTKKQAADMIDSNPFLDGANSLAAIERIQAHQSRWHEERLKLYPELYVYELKEFLRDTLPKSLHDYVRRRVVGATDILTKTKIRTIVDVLTNENSCWWHGSNHQEIFFERLRQMYPGCCDGHTPEQI